METTSSPAHPSADESENEPSGMRKDSWQLRESNDAEATSPSLESGAATSSQTPNVHLPMQKRRRVTRACDECRRKKIKCDGKQPCTHCTVYSYDCTYDQPSNRRRNPAPQYIEALENRLQRTEALLKNILPDIDLNDPNFDSTGPQRMRPSASLDDRIPSATTARPDDSMVKSGSVGNAEKDALLESMVENTGSLDLDDQGNWDFYGPSSGIVFLRSMREQLGDLMGSTESRARAFLRHRRPQPQVFGSPRSTTGESPMDSNLPDTHDFPTRDCAKQLCSVSLNDACALMRFVHQPTFYVSFDKIYNNPPENFGNAENSFLPLFYVVLALGCLFGKDETSRLEQMGYQSAIDQGFQYFNMSRQMMDITDCRDLTSLQAVLFMILFLQSSAKLSTCYSYIGIALRSSLRMGLHRSITHNFNPVEQEVRKRIFWVVQRMDTYVGAMLGLPKMLSDDDIDQDYPLEIDDEFITTERILPMPTGQISLIAASNAHTRILKIHAKVVKYIYPIKSLDPGLHGRSNQSYRVSYARIREIEQDLQEWMENLPMALRPGDDARPDLIRQLLRIAYAHVQIILYRPFLHYVSQSCQAGPVDKRTYACAAACVSVSRNVVHITGEMKKRGLLVGAYWFTMYTTFFAILSLIFFVLENPDSATSHDVLRDANEGKETLASLARRSMAADRCTAMLGGLFDQLPEKLKRSRFNLHPPTKKRHASSPHGIPSVQATRSTPDVTQTITTDPTANMQRASTYPAPVSAAAALKRGSAPYDLSAIRQQLQPPLVDHSYRPGSQHVYLPADIMDMSTPDSTGSSNPSSATQARFTFPQPFDDAAGLPDLSAMMFPSADPFAYPNQPMTTLENKHYNKHETSPFTPPPAQTDHLFAYHDNAAPNNTTVSPYDSLEVQLFGPMPTYMMQGQLPSMGMSAMGGGPVDVGGGMMVMGGEGVDSGGGGVGVPAAAAGGAAGGGGWAQRPVKTGGTPGINMEDIFAEEWAGGWMNQGGRQP